MFGKLSEFDRIGSVRNPEISVNFPRIGGVFKNNRCFFARYENSFGNFLKFSVVLESCDLAMLRVFNCSKVTQKEVEDMER